MEDNAQLPSLIRDPAPEIAQLARRYVRAGGPVITVMTRLGTRLEAQMALLPAGVQRQIERLVTIALQQGHGMAARGRSAPDLGPRAAPVLAALTGAAGGAGGLATSLAELPVTITLIQHSIRRAAEAEGFDPDTPAIRAECLRVFLAGSPLSQDDGVNTVFLGARMAVSGPALQSLISSVAPKLAIPLMQKLGAQAVPLLGAVSGAALNAAFLSYYREMAQIRFALLRHAQIHGAETVLLAFEQAVQAARLPAA